MPVGYYHTELKKHEILISLTVLFIILIPFVDIHLRGTLTELSFIIINGAASFLSVGFLFPRLFYKMKIDFGNFKNTILWFCLLLLFGFGYNK